MKDDIQRDVAEWLRFVKMDQNTACHLFESMHPQPLEIICFHCQQLFGIHNLPTLTKLLQGKR